VRVCTHVLVGHDIDDLSCRRFILQFSYGTCTKSAVMVMAMRTMAMLTPLVRLVARMRKTAIQHLSILPIKFPIPRQMILMTLVSLELGNVLRTSNSQAIHMRSLITCRSSSVPV